MFLGLPELCGAAARGVAAAAAEPANSWRRFNGMMEDMLSRLLFLRCLAGGGLGLSLFAQKQKPPKPPDLEVVEVHAVRTDEGIVIDGTVKNTSARAWVQVQLLINFVGSDRKPLATRRGPIEATELASGEESEFRLRVPDNGKAIDIVINAEDIDKRDLSVRNAGPFRIE